MNEQNEMRERLIEVIRKASEVEIDNDAVIININEEDAGEIADALIASGVIFPKFKIGQEVWEVNYMGEKVYSSFVKNIYINRQNGENTFYRLGNKVGEAFRTADEPLLFATEAEAQAECDRRKRE